MWTEEVGGLKTHCEQRGFRCRHFLLLLFCFVLLLPVLNNFLSGDSSRLLVWERMRT